MEWLSIQSRHCGEGYAYRSWRHCSGLEAEIWSSLVALTGSNGKTTTKEMIAACLETTFPILKTKGNLNNLIGVSPDPPHSDGEREGGGSRDGDE